MDKPLDVQPQDDREFVSTTPYARRWYAKVNKRMEEIEDQEFRHGTVRGANGGEEWE